MNKSNQLKKMQNEMFFRDLELSAIYQYSQQEQIKDREKKRQNKLYKKYLKHLKRKLVCRKMKRFHSKNQSTSKSVSSFKSNASNVSKYGFFAYDRLLENQHHGLNFRI